MRLQAVSRVREGGAAYPSRVEVSPLQSSEHEALLRRRVRGPAQPQVLGAREPRVAVALERPVLAAPYMIDAVVRVFPLFPQPSSQPMLSSRTRA